MEDYPEILKTRLNDLAYEYRREAFLAFLKSPIRTFKESPTVNEYVEITDDDLERMIYGEITVPESNEPVKFEPNMDIVVDNGRIRVNSELEKQGIVVTDMKTALKKHKDLFKKYVNEKYGDDRLEYLINSSWQNGLFVYIPSKVKEATIKTQNISDSTSSFAFKSVIICDDDTKLSLADIYGSTGDGDGVQGKNIYFFLGKRAKVQYNYLQEKGKKVTDITFIKSFESEYSEFSIYHINYGSGRVFFSNESQQFGDGSDYKVFGVSFSDGEQKLDIRDSSFQEGLASNADIQVRGVVTGSSSTMHRGNIDLEEKSVDSTGFYDSKILLLSEEGFANTKPGLMIKNSNTKSKHGSAISSVDDEQILYLRSRGISKDQAVNMITAGFVGSLIERANNEYFTQKVYEFASGIDTHDLF